MKLATYFMAYVKCRDDMASLPAFRATVTRGIAVDSDPEALRWQRRNRLAQKLVREIKVRLETSSEQ